MKLLKYLAAISLGVISYVYAETAENVTNYIPTKQIIYFPQIDTESEVEIGQTLVSKSNVALYPAISIAKNASYSKEQGAFSNRYSGTTTFSAGILSKGYESPKGIYYLAKDGTFTFPGEFLAPAFKAKCICGVFSPNDESLPALMFTLHTWGTTGFDYDIKPIEITKTSPVESWTEGSFKEELIYNGVSQKIVSISYREFKNDYARPAFTQELKYDLNEGATIGFRGARFQIIKANNLSIKYKVIKPLT